MCMNSKPEPEEEASQMKTISDASADHATSGSQQTQRWRKKQDGLNGHGSE